MTSNRPTISVELQDASGDANLPADDDWSRWVNAAVAAADPAGAPGTVTIRLVGHEEGSQLNARWRDRREPTNVLAFSGPENDAGRPGSARLLGDLVICLPVVQAEASEQGKSLDSHLAHLAVHGTLHLLDFDHDTDASAGHMEGVETDIMHELGFDDPYACN